MLFLPREGGNIQECLTGIKKENNLFLNYIFSHLSWLFTYVFTKSLITDYQRPLELYFTTNHYIHIWLWGPSSDRKLRREKSIVLVLDSIGGFETWNIMEAWTRMVIMGWRCRGGEWGAQHTKGKWLNLGTDYKWRMRIKSKWNLLRRSVGWMTGNTDVVGK